MLLICDLPVLVIDNILGHLVSSNRMSSRRLFRKHSQLLAVCPLWRSILLPKLYYKAYVMWVSTSEGYDLDTNLDLITSNQCSVYVRHIEIILNDLECLAIFLYRYKNWLKFSECNWKNMNRIQISISRKSLPIPQLLYVKNIENCPGLSFLEFAENIIQYCPYVKQLHLNFPDDSITSMTVYYKLIKKYSSNLVSLSALYISSFTDSTYFPNLTFLSLDLNADVLIILPKINSKQLQSCQLKNLPLDFTWSAFYDINNVSDNSIVFENLKTLMLSFTTDYLEDEPQSAQNITIKAESIAYNVYFPALQYIIIDNNFKLLSRHNYKFPERLKSMAIYNSIGGLKLLKNAKPDSIQDLKITQTYFDSDNEAEFYSLTQHCLQLCSKSCFSKIRLDMSHVRINWDQTRWHALKQLNLKTSNIRSFLQALIRCPMLECVVLDNLSFCDLSGNDNDIPAHANLSYLKIDSIGLDNCLENNAETYIRRMLINLAKLTTFNISAGRWLDLYDFTRLLGDFYPHLKQLTIKQYLA